jgi:hypothetical protein
VTEDPGTGLIRYVEIGGFFHASGRHLIDWQAVPKATLRSLRSARFFLLT